LVEVLDSPLGAFFGAGDVSKRLGVFKVSPIGCFSRFFFVLDCFYGVFWLVSGTVPALFSYCSA
jgi:hypothetical protein